MPFVNVALMIGVLVLVLLFQTSARLASAYGIAVTGAMLTDTLLAYVVVRRLWKWNLARTACLIAPLLAVDGTFISIQPAEDPGRGRLPLALGAGFVVIMWTWTRGARILTEKAAARQHPPHRSDRHAPMALGRRTAHRRRPYSWTWTRRWPPWP